MALPIETYRDWLVYCPETGIFHWTKTTRQVDTGQIAGITRPGNGYVIITLMGVKVYAHRLAWAFVHGRWPDRKLDHHDHRRDHNAIGNLREATQGQNAINLDPRKVRNPTGLRGVTKSHGKWAAQIVVDGKHVWIGRGYRTPEDAHRAWVEYARRACGQFLPQEYA